MTNRASTSNQSATVELRRKALGVLRGKSRKSSLPRLADPDKLVHELQVHEVELEALNEELRTNRSKLEKLRAKYVELFELAPVAYFTLDERGRILQVNMRGARLLGRQRETLLEAPFASFLARGSHSVFLQHVRDVFKSAERQSCDLTWLEGHRP